MIIKYVLFFLLFIGCSDSSNSNVDTESSRYGKIAEIPEASGICYFNKNDTILVAGDNGFVYELSKNGKILKKKDFSNIAKHDFEGIAYDTQNDEILVAVEGRDDLFVLNTDLIPKANEIIKIERENSDGKLILAKGADNGLEGVAILNGEIYVANQSFDKWPHEDPSAIVKIDSVSNTDAKISKVFPLDYVNISGITFYKDKLYMLSDTGNKLIVYDLKNKSTQGEWDLSKIYKTLKGAGLEGVAFDDNGNIYLTDDRGGKIYKYKFNQ